MLELWAIFRVKVVSLLWFTHAYSESILLPNEFEQRVLFAAQALIKICATARVAGVMARITELFGSESRGVTCDAEGVTELDIRVPVGRVHTLQAFLWSSSCADLAVRSTGFALVVQQKSSVRARWLRTTAS